MDTSKMSQGQMVAAAGGVLLIVSLFLHWGGDVSAWDGFSTMHIVMLLVGLIAIAWAVLPATGSALPPNVAGILLGLGVAVLGFAVGWELEASGGIGVWLAIVGSAAIAYGAYANGRTVSARLGSRSSTPATPAA